MLCALNREHKKQLPTDRIELYEACCSLLLGRRDIERGVELTSYPVLDNSQKYFLLDDLAYWMIKNGLSEVDLKLVDERFDRKLKNLTRVSQDISATGIREFFVERTGMIREPVMGKIDFAHRTFQEYLAAKAAAYEMDTGVLLKNAHDDQWREVIILAVGVPGATKQMCEDLVKGLIIRGDKEQKYRYQLHFLAVSCLETAVELGQEIKVEVEKRLSQLVPPKDMTEAEALAAAGELAVKHL
jgi:predicted NACHT family NTPase